MSPRLPMCLSLLLGLVSCRGGAPSADHDRAVGTPTSPRPAAQALAATQLDLARELAASEMSDDPVTALAALHTRWHGRRLTWTVTRQEMLCRTADACHVTPFPVPAPKDAPRVGWLPALEFAAGQFDKLTAACAGSTLCSVTFEGELTELVVSVDLPTSLRFTNVAVVTATATAATPAATQRDDG
jgi:hypothetical protein